MSERPQQMPGSEPHKDENRRKKQNGQYDLPPRCRLLLVILCGHDDDTLVASSLLIAVK